MNYDNFLLLESAQDAYNKYKYITQYIGKGVSPGSVIDYNQIYNTALNSGWNEGEVAREILDFEKLLDELDNSAKSISVEAEYIVALLTNGKVTNVNNIDTIFSDVETINGEKISVKSSKEKSFSGVLRNSRIKAQQLISVILHNGEINISDSEYNNFFIRINSSDELKKLQKEVSGGGSLFSIAAVYKNGPDMIVEKSLGLTREQILNAMVSHVNTKPSDKYGRIEAGTIIKMGFSPVQRYIIKGIAGTELKNLTNERDKIIKQIQSLSTLQLREIAVKYNLSYK